MTGISGSERISRPAKACWRARQKNIIRQCKTFQGRRFRHRVAKVGGLEARHKLKPHRSNKTFTLSRCFFVSLPALGLKLNVWLTQYTLVCPFCFNAVTVSKAPSNPCDPYSERKNRFECPTCPYQHFIRKRYHDRKLLKQKEVEDIVGGSAQWENAQKTDAQCPDPNCGVGQAFFYQLQIRSADEPMTTFFKVSASCIDNYFCR